jgi:hypothetical protein
MNQLFNFFNWLAHTSIGNHMRDSDWLFPSIEAGHLYGTVVLVSATTILSLRLGGFYLQQVPVSKIVSRCWPWAWFGFVIQMVTGTFLFISEAPLAYINAIYQIKMALVVLAGVNALIFHRTIYRQIKADRSLDEAPDPPFKAKLLGNLSLLIWLLVIIFGRWANGSIAQSAMPK